MIEVKLELEPQNGVSTLDLLVYLKEILTGTDVLKGFSISIPENNPTFNVVHVDVHAEAKP